MRKDFSPEEKLLRLIKGSAKRAPEKDKTDIKTSEHNLSSTFPSHETSGRILQKRSSIGLSFNIKDISAKNINPVLAVILAGLLIYLLADIIHNPYGEKEAEIESAASREPVEAKEGADSPKPYNYYAADIDGRNIFLPQESDVSTAPAGPSAEEIKANLSLIGIIAGDKPQAIIEDKKMGKSYFLYKGGSAGQAKIIEIMEDKVLVEYGGETFELVL